MGAPKPNQAAMEEIWKSHADSLERLRQDEDELRRIIDLIAQALVVRWLSGLTG